ncbi:MAG: hypothetical protein ACHP65_04565, partial [Legionellales bacterium]
LLVHCVLQFCADLWVTIWMQRSVIKVSMLHLMVKTLITLRCIKASVLTLHSDIERMQNLVYNSSIFIESHAVVLGAVDISLA